MIKFISGILLGVFAGALTVEIIQRLKPELTTKVEGKAKSVADHWFSDGEDLGNV